MICTLSLFLPLCYLFAPMSCTYPPLHLCLMLSHPCIVPLQPLALISCTHVLHPSLPLFHPLCPCAHVLCSFTICIDFLHPCVMPMSCSHFLCHFTFCTFASMSLTPLMPMSCTLSISCTHVLHPFYPLHHCIALHAHVHVLCPFTISANVSHPCLVSFPLCTLSPYVVAMPCASFRLSDSYKSYCIKSRNDPSPKSEVNMKQKSVRILSSTCIWVAEWNKHLISNPLMVSDVSAIPTGSNFNFC